MFRMLISGLLICSIVICNVGYFPLFKLEQAKIRKAIKHKIKNSIPENQLHEFRFKHPATDVIWTREGKEFRLHDRMYDIVRSKREGNFTVFYCVNDVEETVLFAHLDDFVKKYMQDKSKNSKKKRTSRTIAYFPLFCEDFTAELNWSSLELKTEIPPYQFSVKNAVQSIYSPPPQSFSI